MFCGGGISAVALLVLGEIAFRECLGMCDAPLYDESDKWEYMARPNQDGYRFGNHYHYNSYRQRSEEPDSTKSIVLGLGDSVLFGGVMTDQDSTSTYVFNSFCPSYQMLNISAGSWGPDNCAAYLNEYGLFGAKAMFLLVSSHDAHDNIDLSNPVVGKHPSYPNHQYFSAWIELIDRYVWPRTIGKWLDLSSKDPDAEVLKSVDGTDIKKKGKAFNKGFDQLKQMADKANIPLYICLHPDVNELKEGRYNEQGQEIIEWCKENGIVPILELNEGLTSDMFRDGIHTNVKGQNFEARLMKKYILQNK
ncbi:MAG: hypothetical protein PUC90_07165 [Prevotella sp.]|nr:hypothetical protein [Prevotella sp.]